MLRRGRYHTPGTRLEWSSLAEWHAALWRLDGRRAAEAKYVAMDAHIRALPLALIYGTTDRDALENIRHCLKGWNTPGRRPLRGHRRDAPQTALIMALNNRLAQLARQEDLDSIPLGHNSRAMLAKALPPDKTESGPPRAVQPAGRAVGLPSGAREAR